MGASMLLFIDAGTVVDTLDCGVASRKPLPSLVFLVPSDEINEVRAWLFVSCGILRLQSALR